MGETATELAAEHVAGRADPRVSVEHALARAHAGQEAYNCFALIDDAGARAAAARIADILAAELASGLVTGPESGALAGVPVSVKDILDVAGLPTKLGSRLMADAPAAKSDINAVARLRAAGAIILGKTTTSEFAHAPLGVSPLTGVTRNPWAPDLTCGGSSAGAGVSVAAGIVPLALATDAGCSTRLPAACTGTYGMKPTLGAIAHDRVPDGFGNFIHLGLIAADLGDIELGLAALAGAHRADPQSLGCALAPAPASGALRGARVTLWLRTGNQMVSAEMVEAAQAAAAHLRACGAVVVEAAYPFAHPDPIWRRLQQANWAVRFAAAPPEQRALLSDSFNQGIDAGAACGGMDLARAAAARTALFRGVQGVFAEAADFILTPCISTAPVAAEYDLAQPLRVDGVEAGDLRSEWTPYLSLFDLTGHPAIALPCGIGAAGVPLAVQLVAPWGADWRLLAAARDFAALCPAPRLRAG